MYTNTPPFEKYMYIVIYGVSIGVYVKDNAFVYIMYCRGNSNWSVVYYNVTSEQKIIPIISVSVVHISLFDLLKTKNKDTRRSDKKKEERIEDLILIRLGALEKNVGRQFQFPWLYII